MAGSSNMTVSTRACDACRLRRKRCDYSESTSENNVDISCARCTTLQLRCTYDQPSRTRGRKKRGTTSDAEANQRTSVPRHPQSHLDVEPGACTPTLPLLHFDDSCTTHLDSSLDSHSSPVSVRYPIGSSRVRNAQIEMSSTPSNVLVAAPSDVLCSRELLLLILDDYLRYIYPLVPLVHRPSFLADLCHHRDVKDIQFYRLLIGVAAMVISNLPARLRVYQNHDMPLCFRTRREAVIRCYNIVVSNQTPDHFDQINHLKWATCYALRIAFYHIGDHNRCRMLDVEGMQMARLLGFHDIREYEGLNCIEIQLRKKAFWLTFFAYVHSKLSNLRKERLSYIDPDILAAIKLQDVLPLEVDDEMIYEDRWVPQPPSKPCVTSGFVIHSRVFWAALRSAQATTSTAHEEDACYCCRIKYPQTQIAHLKARLRELKYMLDKVPSRLRPWTSLGDESSWHEHSSENYILESQFLTMRANLHSTHIWLQSILIDQLEAVIQSKDSTASPQDPFLGTQEAIWSVREELSCQLLHVLHSIPLENLEPNGLNITEKIREVAVSLLSCPFSPEDDPSRRAAEYVREFTEIIAKFELDPIHTSNTQTWIDTDRVMRNHTTIDTPSAASVSQI